MSSHAARERTELVRALGQAGPDAPTLCEGWTAHDLAAHLVARERRPDSGPGIMIGALSGWTERVRRGYTARPFGDLLALIASGPPVTSPFALPGVDAAANLTEHFVHTEDVRRAAAGWTARDLDPELRSALRRLVTRRGRLLFRQARDGLVLTTPDGTEHRLRPAPDGAPDRDVRISGEPEELLLYAFGRTAQATVELHGSPEALERFRALRLEV